MVLLSMPIQTMQISLLTNQSVSKRILNNETNDNTQAIVNELRKMRSVLEVSAPRQVILTIVSFFVAIAFTVFGVQLAFRPEKTEIKYFRVAIM
jgi:preprotein translocase subunit SecY